MKLIFNYNQANTKYTSQEKDVDLPDDLKRKSLPLCNVNEVQIIRHYTELSRKNYGIDTNFYPLGSCTMKYNPKINEDIARFPQFTSIHPLQPNNQGCMQLMYELSCTCLK